MTLVEVLAAITVFAIAASGLALSLVYSKKSVRDSRLRVQAANLASRESEIVRNAFTASSAAPVALGATSLVLNPDPLPGGTAGQPLVVDSTPFTVKRTTEWVPAGTGTSACDGGSTVTYPTLAVHIEVSWPNMSFTTPVVTNTVLTPPKGTLNSTLGFVAVKVTGVQGPVEGMPVTLSGVSGPFTRTTESDGCTVFSVTVMGAYTATVNQPGYVTSDLATSASKSVTVTAGTLQQAPFAYDRAVTLQTTYTTLSGYALPSSLPQATVYNSGLPAPIYSKSFAMSSSSSALTGLWPFAVGYNVWSSACLQADPATAGNPAGRPAATSLTPGISVSQVVQLAPVQLTVMTAAGVAVSGVTVVAMPASSTNCPSAEAPLTLGVTDSAGVLRTSLPQGKYTLSATGKSPSGSWPLTAQWNPYATATSYNLTTT